MREGCTERIIVSGSDAAFMAFGKGDDPADVSRWVKLMPHIFHFRQNLVPTFLDFCLKC